MVKTEKIPEGYRATEAGILPADWQVQRLSEVATELTEQAGQDSYETVSISAGIGFVNQAEKFGKELSGKQYEKYIVLHQGDFSYNKGNSKTSPQGCIYRLNDRETAAVPNVFESFRIEDQNADYYEQLFLSGFLNKQLYSKINHGVRDDGLLNLTGKDFYSCMVPIPSVAEQKKIAEILAQCDRVIELKQELIADLHQLKKALLQAMFPAKGQNKPEIRFPGFTDAWEQRKVTDLLRNSSSAMRIGPFGSALKKEFFVEDGVKVYAQENTFTGDFSIGNYYITEEKYKELQSCELCPGDLVISMMGTIGACAIFPENAEKGIMNSHLLRLQFNERINPKYIMYLLRDSEQIRSQIDKLSVGSIMSGLSSSVVKKLIFPVTNIEEQNKIVDFFDVFDNLITLHQRELEETKKKRKVLAQLLLTGIVRMHA